MASDANLMQGAYAAAGGGQIDLAASKGCLLYTSPSPRDRG